MSHHSFEFAQAKQVGDAIYATALDGVLVLKASLFPDERGSYAELSRIVELETVLATEFKIQQLNCAFSNTNVARGFHAENWQKLVTPLSGELMVVLLDVRSDSPTFGQTLGMNFGSGQLPLQTSYYLPAGIAHGLFVAKGPAYLIYAVDALYKSRDPKFDVAIALNSEGLSIPWTKPLSECTMSTRDRAGISLAKWVSLQQS